MPGQSEDVFSGACPSCYYAGKGHECGRRSGPSFQQGLEPHVPVVGSADAPLKNNGKRPQSQPAQEVPASPRRVEEDEAQNVSAGGQDSHDLEHEPQDSRFQNNRKRPRSKPVREVPASAHRAEEDQAQNVSTGGQDLQDLKHKSHDLAYEVGRRTRILPPGEQRAMLKRVEILLAMDGLGFDELDMARSVLEHPDAKRAEIAEDMIDILRPMLDQKPFL